MNASTIAVTLLSTLAGAVLIAGCSGGGVTTVGGNESDGGAAEKGTGSSGSGTGGGLAGLGGGSSSGTGTASKDAGSTGGGAACGLSTGSATCDACVAKSCCSQASTCAGNPQCAPLLQCLEQCAPNDNTCDQQCGQEYQNGLTDLQAAVNCANTSCATECS